MGTQKTKHQRTSKKGKKFSAGKKAKEVLMDTPTNKKGLPSELAVKKAEKMKSADEAEKTVGRQAAIMGMNNKAKKKRNATGTKPKNS